MDVLSDILKKIKLSSAIYFKSDFSAPWGMEIPKGPFAQFHIVTRGQCVLKTKNDSLQLFAGDIVIFPLGTSHWLADVPLSKRHQGQLVVESIIKGKSLFEGDNIATTIVCGHFEFDIKIDHPFIQDLPEIIHISDLEKKDLSWLESIVNLLIQETSSERSGSLVISNKLGEILFIYALRAYIQKNSSHKGFVAAMRDNRISKVLKSIHQNPSRDWQVQGMAQIAGMSRTSFSNKFKKLIGETPMHYIMQWRMLQAKELLKETEKSVSQIAEEVGYQSEAAFNRIFKKRVKQTPLKYRHAILLV